MNKEINELREKLSKKKGVLAVYLFGGAVEGRVRGISDIDICIIGKLNDGEKKQILRWCSEELDVSFFDELPIAIKFRVFKEGRELFVRDESTLDYIKLVTLKEYRDYYEIIKRRISERFKNV